MHIPDLELVGSTTGGLIPAAAAAGVSFTLFVGNVHRRGFFAQNASSNVWYLKYGSEASSSSFHIMIPSGALYEMPRPWYTGTLTVSTDVANVGILIVTELGSP